MTALNARASRKMPLQRTSRTHDAGAPRPLSRTRLALAAGLLMAAPMLAGAASVSYTGNTVASGQGIPLYIVLAPENQSASTFLASAEGTRWKTVANTEGARVVVMDGGTTWDTGTDVSSLASLYNTQTASGIEGASRYIAAYNAAGTTLAAYAAQYPNNLAGVAFINATSSANLTGLTKPQRALAVLTVNSTGTGMDDFVAHFRTENARGGTEGSDTANANDLRYYRTGSSAWNADYSTSHFVRRLSGVASSTDMANLVYTNLFNKVSRWKTVSGDFTLRAKVRAGMVPGFDRITETVGGSSRSAYVYVPTAVRNNPTVAVPVVMLFHGVTANGNYFQDQTEWHRVAEQNNFIVYAPTAPGFSWSLSTDGPRYRTLINGFATNGITAANGTKYAVDPRRVYMYGFSNGSVFVSGYSMTYPETIAAAAPWSIADNPGSSTKALPVWYGIGSQDTDYYPNDGGVEYINHMKSLAGSTSSQTINYSAFGVSNRIATTVHTGGTVEVRYSLASGIVHGNVNEHMNNIWRDFFARYRKKNDGSGLSELIPTGNVAPTANFTSATSGLTASFTDTSTDSDGTIASRNWNFGDGSSSTVANPTKTYASANTYTVTLTVTDNAGATNSTAKPVTVSSGTPTTYSVSGTITSSTGTALSGVSVSNGSTSVTTNASGAYTFSGLNNGTYTLTPSLSGYTFSPVNRSVTVNGANVTAQNFTGTASGGGGGASQLLINPGFESGNVTWASSSTGSSAVITSGTSATPRTGSWVAWMRGYGTTGTDTLSQSVSIPAGKTSATLSFWLRITSNETTTTTAYDTLKVEVRNSAGTVLKTCATYSNLDKATSYVQRTCDLTPYIGQTVSIRFTAVEDSADSTSFRIDDTALNVQ